MTPVFILDDVKDVLYDYCYGQSAGNNELKDLADDEETTDDRNISIEDIEEVHSDCEQTPRLKFISQHHHITIVCSHR